MPNKAQEQLLQKHFGSCRFIYNYFLDVKIKHYKETKETIGWVALANQLPELKTKFEWLNETSAQSLQQSLLNLDHAYTAFFRSNAGFPKFKSKKRSRKSFIAPQGTNIKLKYDIKRLGLPKFKGGIKCIFDREIPTEYKVKQATVTQNSDGRYYASILVEIDGELPVKPKATKAKAIGLDFGVKTFITLSNGEKIESNKAFKCSKDKLAKHQQELALLKKGSTAHISKQEQVTKLHSKIARQRKDFLDKLSYKLTHDNQVNTICIEDLSIKSMLQDNQTPTNRFIGDYAWGSFVHMLQYKGNWYGKNFYKIGRFDPSSKMCSQCGNINHALTLNDREWVCAKCETKHDRDVNAAKNIVDFAFPKTKYKMGRNYPIET